MQTYRARRVLRADRCGSSWPLMVDTEAGVFYTKLRGAAQAPASLVAEIIVGSLADALGLWVPARVLIEIQDRLAVDDLHEELAQLIRQSVGLNLGFQYLSGVRPFLAVDAERVDADPASRIVWLDRFVQNPDRRARNPNLLWSHGQLWLIDHGASLGFHHDWRRVTEEIPRTRGWRLDDHVLQSRATRLALVDEECAGRLDRDTLQSALDAVPGAFCRRRGPKPAASARGVRGVSVEAAQGATPVPYIRSARGHAEPRTSKSEARHRRQSSVIVFSRDGISRTGEPPGRVSERSGEIVRVNGFRLRIGLSRGSGVPKRREADVRRILSVVVAVPLFLPASLVSGQGASPSGVRPQAGEALPKDVHQDSRSRLPVIKREGLNDQLKKEKAYDAAAAASPTGRPEGDAAIRLHRSGVDVRWDSPVGRRLTELAIITTAREHDQPYEWSLHEMEALSVGLEPTVVDVVRHRRPLTGIGDKEAAIIQFGRELGKHKVTSETYARALKLFGQTNLVDVLDLMAQYAGTASNLTAANQWMPPQMKQFLPLPFTPPSDILPDSRSRIPLVNPDQPPAVPAQGQPVSGGLYRRTLAPPPTGPASMGRFAAGLDSLASSQGRAVMALAVLVTAREHDQQYDWSVNEPAALRDGLSAATIDVVRLRKPLTGMSDKEAAIIQFGRELFGRHYVTAETYARAKQILGQRDLSDIVVGLMAPHAREATLLTAFDQHLPAGQRPHLPIP
jgi:hypothetical protein